MRRGNSLDSISPGVKACTLTATFDLAGGEGERRDRGALDIALFRDGTGVVVSVVAIVVIGTIGTVLFFRFYGAK